MTFRHDRVAITPESDAAWKAMKALDVTSTESSALFGLCPYFTEFELWHSKRDRVVREIEENERMEWGTGLQYSIAQVLARRHGVKCKPVFEYMSLNLAHMGSSFDFEIDELTISGVTAAEFKSNMAIATMLTEHGPGIFEIKAVDYAVFRDEWRLREDGHREAPGHIEIQVQHQMHVRGNKWGAIGVLVGGNRGYVIIRKYDEKVGQIIEHKIRALWKSIEANKPPPPVFPGDETFISTLYNKAESGKVVDLRGADGVAELVEQYKASNDAVKLAKEDCEIARAKLLIKFGDAEKAIVDGGSFDCGITHAGHVSYDRAEFRRFKFNPKKDG